MRASGNAMAAAAGRVRKGNLVQRRLLSRTHTRAVGASTPSG